MIKSIPSFLAYTLAGAAVVLVCVQASAQNNAYPYKVAQDRMLWHDNVDREQKRLLGLGGNKSDSLIRLVKDENVNLQITDALIRQVDELQEGIEFDSTLNTNNKKRYLRGLEFLLRGYEGGLDRHSIQPSMAPALVEAYKVAMELDKKGLSIEPVIEGNSYGVGMALVDCFLLPYENVGIKPSRLVLIRKYCELHQGSIMDVLRQNPDLPFADSLIIVAGHRDIRQLYDFAAASNGLGWRIRNSKDSVVHMVALMATSKSGQLYFPFLDNLVKGRTSLEEIDKVKGDDMNYYHLLVRTRQDYALRVLEKDTPLEMNALTDMLEKKGKEIFVREINALHTVENPAVRFKVLDPLSPVELYYLIVLSEDEIYTSSYLGVYDRIFQRMAAPFGDSLLLQVHGDYFRKFIKMAAAYNKLDHFLGTMDRQNAGTVMRSFIIHLENANEEEAVDVADSYSSIFEKNPTLARFILDEVKANYEKNKLAANKKGIIIYKLLQTLFESADTTTKTDLSASLGIPPVYKVDYHSLADDSGRVVQQVFFYGDKDKDGQNSYADFMALFHARPGTKPEWKVTENPQWTTITSIRGRPVLIFANKPLLGDDDPDDKAQKALGTYLVDHHLKPTIVIHRGHSYHVKYTIGQMAPTARIVVLGSCGGYNNLSEVLKINEDAHIISSKQVGTKTVNEPILQAINNTLLAGKDIEWLPMWKELSARFQNDLPAKEKFDDYIPPYKNLGAIFIKAYRKAMAE
ncbi:MAG: hypothetical protein Q8927_03335 [Bacteroidota bacterium]|nr:hypothetical protein [Bacteroidota bacterium]MDP4215208.1 hypothetical protein [Bacteroidota bacterium]MDP4247714.1 hypothetical protein [Bacteroidota bacterium]MDP4254549.1 hypothetical protein [Bacteroidota bacterium]